MSAPTATDLRTIRRENRLALERVRAVRLRRLEKAETRRDLRESLSLDWVTPYAEMLDRLRWHGDPVFSGPTSFWQRRHGRNWPIFQTEQELSLLRAPSRLLCATNDDAIGLVNGVSAYVIGSGYTYRPAKRDMRSEFPDEAVSAIQKIVDGILERNEWSGGELPGVEDEAFWRSLEDGEYLLLAFPQSDGWTHFRFAEPEQLTQPPGTSEYDWLFGVCTERDDISRPLAYWFQHGDIPSEGDELPPDRVTHLRRNGRRGQKRGLPEFAFSLYEKLDLANKVRLNLSTSAAVQASITMVRQHEMGVRSDVEAFVDDDGEFQQRIPLTGEQENARIFRKGGVEDIPKGYQYVDGPGAPYADKHLAILDACLRGAVARWNGFEWLISANAGSNNLPVDLSAESPFVRRVFKEQNRYTGAFKRAIWPAVKHYVQTRGLFVNGRRYDWDEIAREVDLIIEAPSPETRNKLEETQRAAIEIPLGLDSRQRYMQSQHRDVDQIESDNKTWDEQHPQPGQSMPGMDDMSQLAGVAESEVDRVIGRALLESGFTGTITDSAGRERHYLNGKQVAANQDADDGDHDGTPGGMTTAADSRASRILAAAKNIPAHVMAQVRDKVASAYSRLEKRYGKTYARVIVAAGVSGLPIPLPGASVMMAAPVLAVAELHRQLAGKVTEGADGVTLTGEEIEAAAEEFVRESGVKTDVLEREGLVAKKITVNRKDGKSYQRTVWVKSQDAPKADTKKADKKPAAKEKPKPADVKAEVAAAFDDPASLTPEKVQDLAAKLKTLPVAELKAMQKARGLDGTDKEARVRRIVDAVKAGAFGGGKAKPAPATPAATPKKAPTVSPSSSPGASRAADIAGKLKSGTHSIETVRQFAPILQKLSKADVAEVAKSAGYPTLAKGRSKAEMIRGLMSNLENLAMSRMRVDIIDKIGGPDTPMKYDPSPFDTR